MNGKTATNLELPLDTDQATKFLDEHDLHDVLNKMPDEAFDLLTGKFSQYSIFLRLRRQLAIEGISFLACP